MISLRYFKIDWFNSFVITLVKIFQTTLEMTSFLLTLKIKKKILEKLDNPGAQGGNHWGRRRRRGPGRTFRRSMLSNLSFQSFKNSQVQPFYFWNIKCLDKKEWNLNVCILINYSVYCLFNIDVINWYFHTMNISIRIKIYKGNLCLGYLLCQF